MKGTSSSEYKIVIFSYGNCNRKSLKAASSGNWSLLVEFHVQTSWGGEIRTDMSPSNIVTHSLINALRDLKAGSSKNHYLNGCVSRVFCCGCLLKGWYLNSLSNIITRLLKGLLWHKAWKRLKYGKWVGGSILKNCVSRVEQVKFERALLPCLSRTVTFSPQTRKTGSSMDYFSEQVC